MYFVKIFAAVALLLTLNGCGGVNSSVEFSDKSTNTINTNVTNSNEQNATASNEQNTTASIDINNQQNSANTGASDTVSELTTFSEDFSNGLSNWTLFGSPLPLIVDSVYGKNYVFDNNGDSNYDSGAYSNQKITLIEGNVVEADVYVDFSDLNGCWAGDAIYLSENENPQTSSTQAPKTSLGWWLQTAGDACWATDSKYRGHSWFYFKMPAEDGTFESSPSYTILADNYVNGWHKAKIKIRNDRQVEFYIDDTLLWTSTKKVDIQKLANKRLVLGNRSSGSAGKAYIDNIKIYNNKRSVLLVNDLNNIDVVSLELKKIMGNIDVVGANELQNGTKSLSGYDTIACFIYGGDNEVSNFSNEVLYKIKSRVENGATFVSNNEVCGGKVFNYLGIYSYGQKSDWFPALKDSNFIVDYSTMEPLFANVIKNSVADPKTKSVDYWDSIDDDSLIFRVDNTRSYTGRYGVNDGTYLIQPDKFLVKYFGTGFSVSDTRNGAPQWNIGQGKVVDLNFIGWTFDQATKNGGYIGKAGREILKNIAN